MLLAEKYAQADINAVKSYERNEGRIEGLREGRIEGLREGRNEGRIEGLTLAVRIIAESQAGMSDEQIASKYGYSVDDIKAALGHK